MNVKVTKRNYLLQPAIATADLIVLIACAAFYSISWNSYLIFSVFIAISWLITSVGIGFYKVYRFTPLVRILALISKQSFLLLLSAFTFFGIFSEIDIAPIAVLEYTFLSMIVIAIVKILTFSIRKKLRRTNGEDTTRVIILGRNSKTEKLKNFFEYNPVYGFKLIANFDLIKEDLEVRDIANYVLQNQINEIYCSVAELTNREIKKLIQFADNNMVTLKFLPDNKDIFTKKMDFQYYGITPILALRTLPVNAPINMFLKRLLDFIIALLVILGILSWLTPLLALIIFFESRGPLFFKQARNGIDGKEFYCYKFRSMKINNDANKQQASKNDTRITKVGKFIRKTSLDEFPQFYNVLMGDMSVVGPRPHMVTHTQSYASQIDKYMLRHLVKPGITGLAQVSGYRGEIENPQDIKNRVRFDIFYVENWSILMDLRIIAKTFFQVIYGDKKAY